MYTCILTHSFTACVRTLIYIYMNILVTSQSDNQPNNQPAPKHKNYLNIQQHITNHIQNIKEKLDYYELYNYNLFPFGCHWSTQQINITHT